MGSFVKSVMADAWKIGYNIPVNALFLLNCKSEILHFRETYTGEEEIRFTQRAFFEPAGRDR
jgi:hypothetical protein